MSDTPKRRFRFRDLVFLLAVLVAFLVIVGILWQGFISAD